MKCFIDEDLPKCAGGKVQAQHRARLKNWDSFPLWLAALANARASIKSHGGFTNWRIWYYYYLDWRSHEPWPNDNTFFLIFSFLFLTFWLFDFFDFFFFFFLHFIDFSSTNQGSGQFPVTSMHWEVVLIGCAKMIFVRFVCSFHDFSRIGWFSMIDFFAIWVFGGLGTMERTIVVGRGTWSACIFYLFFIFYSYFFSWIARRHDHILGCITKSTAHLLYCMNMILLLLLLP